MTKTVDNLILDLLEWIGPDSRPYAETMEAWRTSCPRLPVWEDATDAGFITRYRDPGQGRQGRGLAGGSGAPPNPPTAIGVTPADRTTPHTGRRVQRT